jgi:hypothetical protein
MIGKSHASGALDDFDKYGSESAQQPSAMDVASTGTTTTKDTHPEPLGEAQRQALEALTKLSMNSGEGSGESDEATSQSLAEMIRGMLEAADQQAKLDDARAQAAVPASAGDAKAEDPSKVAASLLEQLQESARQSAVSRAFQHLITEPRVALGC